ncbi:lytic murein transglycosylase B [Wielerella bovis]|uniref:lytic murein transglycosylase B n=1 Tax=Wielerella bovis TaxID=2917790 RepID=UPI0020187064|nr:lytic murein transglycosylase B [Wielerella bovis]ULJ64592.1 lytic murein transglycosylase B [Wielerella bovis]ULJ66881.1 lytic murein transglycosylase B [Wielerella bovis]
MKTAIYPLSVALVLSACSSELQPVVQTTPAQDPIMDILNHRPQAVPTPITQPETPFFNQYVAPVSQTGFLANPNVQAFIQYQNRVNGLDINYLNDFFSRVNYRGNLINIMNRPATSTPWYKFRTGNSGAAKVSAGRSFYAQNRAAIDAAAAQYGVPAEIITAIIGIETNYGKNMGSVRTGDALATLAFDYPRRGAFFQKELGEFLKMAQEERRDPFSFTGSFAGAMGMPQFMPSSFRKWAVDFDRDGRRNIWNNVPDVAASVANYMRQHGWQPNGRMIVPVRVPNTAQIQALVDEKTALNYTVGQLRQMGVQPLQPVADNERALLYRLEISPNQYEYFIGLNNFYAVWQYNHSRMYVTAVRDIANGISGGNL